MKWRTGAKGGCASRVSFYRGLLRPSYVPRCALIGCGKEIKNNGGRGGSHDYFRELEGPLGSRIASLSTPPHTLLATPHRRHRALRFFSHARNDCHVCQNTGGIGSVTAVERCFQTYFYYLTHQFDHVPSPVIEVHTYPLRRRSSKGPTPFQAFHHGGPAQLRHWGNTNNCSS